MKMVCLDELAKSGKQWHRKTVNANSNVVKTMKPVLCSSYDDDLLNKTKREKNSGSNIAFHVLSSEP
jgi:hypothetical protein